MNNTSFIHEDGSKLSEGDVISSTINTTAGSTTDISNGGIRMGIIDDNDNKIRQGKENPISDGTVRMKREIGLIGGIAMIVGTMIGSGIFVSPTGLLKRTDSIYMSLLVWAGCGILATMAALVYCELGTVVPKSGGEHAYFMAAFKPLNRFAGEIPAFLFALISIVLLKPSSLAIISLTFANYAIRPFNTCNEWKENDYDYELARKLLAISCASFIAFINIFSVKIASRVQIIFTFAKLTAVAVVVGIGIYNLAKGKTDGFPEKFDFDSGKVGEIPLAFYSGLWAYDGWNNLNFLTEEIKNPSKNLPRAILIGLPLVTVSYILVNVAYITGLNKLEIIGSDAVAIDFGDSVLGVMKWIIPVLVALSAIGTSNGSQFSAGRIAYVAGRDGHMVDVLSYVHSTRLTPLVAILLNLIIAIGMIFGSDINKLIDFFSAAAWIFYGLSMVALIVLRKTMPDAPRPFKVPIIIPVLTILIAAYLVIGPIISEPEYEYFIVMAFSVFGLVIYYPFIYKKYQPWFMPQVTRWIQLTTLVAPSPYKAD